MPKILLCGPCSNRASVTGVSLAFDLLIQGLKDSKIEIKIIDALDGKKANKSGAFSLQRAVTVIKTIVCVWFNLLSFSAYYATMSTSSLGFMRDFLTVTVAKLVRKKVVLHLHGGGFEDFYLNAPPGLKFLIRLNLRCTDKIIVLGDLLKKQFYCAGDFVKNKLIVVPNGLTLGVDEPKALVKAITSKAEINLLYLSNLITSKGFIDVLNAMIELQKQSGIQFHLDLCGTFVDTITEATDGMPAFSNESQLTEYIQKEGLGGFITYHGQVVGTEKEFLLKKAHIFILPTYYPWEGQPLSIIEAMAYSTPIISCFHKGIPEMLEDGCNGYFVSPQNPSDIAEKVERICRDPELYSAMSKYSREKYELEFKREVHLERLITELKSVHHEN